MEAAAAWEVAQLMYEVAPWMDIRSFVHFAAADRGHRAAAPSALVSLILRQDDTSYVLGMLKNSAGRYGPVRSTYHVVAPRPYSEAQALAQRLSREYQAKSSQEPPEVRNLMRGIKPITWESTQLPIPSSLEEEPPLVDDRSQGGALHWLAWHLHVHFDGALRRADRLQRPGPVAETARLCGRLSCLEHRHCGLGCVGPCTDNQHMLMARFLYH